MLSDRLVFAVARAIMANFQQQFNLLSNQFNMTYNGLDTEDEVNALADDPTWKYLFGTCEVMANT